MVSAKAEWRGENLGRVSPLGGTTAGTFRTNAERII